MGSLSIYVTVTVILCGINTKQVICSTPVTVRSVQMNNLKSQVRNITAIRKQDSEDGKSSLAFVFDITGSMYDDLRQLREGAHMILDAIVESPNAHISNFVLVPFEDPGYGPATVTEDPERFREALNQLELFGGGDCPEMALSGIREALSVSQPKSYVYVFTDASATDHFILSGILDQVQRKQSQIVFILTGDCRDRDKPSFQAYHKIAAASSGQVFELQKTNVHKVLQYVKSSVAGRRVNLGSVNNPAGYNYTQEVPIDQTLGEVTVSVSGSNPRIKVIDPKGKEVTGPPKLVKTLDLDAIMVVSLVNPEPGNWSITVGSRDQHSVKVTGLSNFTFQHGFSVHPPQSLRETSHRPLQGAENYLTVRPSEMSDRVDIKFAELVSTDGKLLFELPLKPLKNDKALYLAGPFLPPDDFFYIAVNGVDESNNNARRIGPTAIQPQLPDVPFITVQEKVEAHLFETVVLKCNIESLVPVTAQWFKDNTRLQDKISSLQSTSIEYVIESMGPEKEGSYRCVASNIAGFSKAISNVTLVVDPPRVTLSPGNVTVSANEMFEVKCSVNSQLPLTNFLFEIVNGKRSVFTGPPHKVDDVYYYTTNISTYTSGTYICQAKNKGGESRETSYVDVLKPLKANIVDVKPVLTELHRSVNLTCRIENGESVIWTDPKGVNRSVTHGISIVKYDSVYTVHDMLHSDGGLWTCVTVRRKEIVQDSVMVIFKPIVQPLEHNNMTAVYGENVTVDCRVYAMDQREVRWTNANRELVPATIISMQDHLIVSRAVFRNVTNKSEGTYYCKADNAAGSDSKNFTLQTWQKQSIVNISQDLNIDIYSNAKLICHIQSYPISKISWSHNGTTLSDGTNDAYESSTLHIQDMDFSKTGDYTCLAKNEYERGSYSIKVGISGLERPVIEKTSNDLVVLEGDAVQIPCRLLKGKPLPTLTWQYQNGASLDVTNIQNIHKVDDQTSMLNLTNIRVDQNGTYVCKATNLLGSDFHNVSLVVQFPPRLQSRPDEPEGPLEVMAGSPVTLSCHAVGEPQPLITWSKDHMPVAYSDNVYLDDRGSLVMRSINEYDAGLFLCTATSALGLTRKNFTLVVVAPPSLVGMAKDGHPEIEKVEGELVELRCAVRGLPAPRLQWTHNNRTVKSDARRQIDQDFTLRFVANLTDFGEYKCTAINKAGEVTRTYFLFIWVTPYMDLPYEAVESQLGEAVALKCDAVGFPVPTITWTFGKRPLAENISGIRYNDTGYVWINNMTSEHEGSYVCSAENRAGVAQKYIRLNVNKPPSIVRDNSSNIVALSSDVEINIPCVATGKPRPHVLWSKDGVYLDQDARFKVHRDGTLTVRMPTTDLSGNYTCEAVNKAGRDATTFTVRVYLAPSNIQMDEAESKVVMVEGTNDTLQCNVKGSDDDTIKWYKDGQYIGDGKLTLTNVSRENASSYACVVSNVIGAASSLIQLHVEWPPRFKTDVATASQWEVVERDDIYLDCETDSKPVAQTKWFLDSKPMPTDETDKLVLRNMKRQHAGLYMCVVTNTHGMQMREYDVRVLIPPQIRDVAEVEMDFKEGSYATLQCSPRGVPKPEVNWHYNNTNWLVQNSSLICKNTTKQSEGLFQCISRNKAGVASLMYRVNILSPAVVKEITVYGDEGSKTVLEKVEVVAGNTVRISCSGEGIPTPEVQWSRHGRTVSSNEPQVYYSDLSIKSAQKADEGVYICVVSNEAGRQERTIHLDILMKPKIFKNIFANPNETASEEVEIITGQPMRLHCHPYGNPLPSIYWFRDDSLLRFYDDTMYTEEFGEVLYVRSSAHDQSGNYTCVAKNKVGVDSVSYLLNVLVPPQSELKDNETVKVRAKQDMNVKLSCPFQGNPPPHIIWLKHPYTEISKKLFPKIVLEENNSTMVIFNSTIMDSGKYTCVVTNRVGALEVTFEVVVEKAPVILPDGPTADASIKTQVVPLKWSIVLHCPVEAYPLPKITWWKDTVVLSTNISRIQQSVGGTVLSVRETTPRDAGQYICVAENSAGSAHRRFNIRIMVPGEWSKWSSWSLCNATCGHGAQRRWRVCHYLGNDGLRVVSKNANGETNDTVDASVNLLLDQGACSGPADHTRPCHMPPCEEEEEVSSEKGDRQCAVSAWSGWSECGPHCTQSRSRSCRCTRDTSFDACRADNVQIRKCVNVSRCNPAQQSDVNPQERYSPEVTYETEPEAVGHPLGSSRAGNERSYHIGADTNVHTIVCQNSTQCGTMLNSQKKRLKGTKCDVGFKYDPSTKQCEDVDECLMDNNECHSTQLCENTAGGYRCYCEPGYSSLGAGQRCLDMNECELELHRCEYACVNTAGGYVCACPRRLRLHTDRHSCIDPRSSASQLHDLYKNVELRDGENGETASG